MVHGGGNGQRGRAAADGELNAHRVQRSRSGAAVRSGDDEPGSSAVSENVDGRIPRLLHLRQGKLGERRIERWQRLFECVALSFEEVQEGAASVTTATPGPKRPCRMAMMFSRRACSAMGSMMLLREG